MRLRPYVLALVTLACVGDPPSGAAKDRCRNWKVRYVGDATRTRQFDWCDPRAGTIACGFGARDSEPHAIYLGRFYAVRQRCEP